jgi:hypothetical protein
MEQYETKGPVKVSFGGITIGILFKSHSLLEVMGILKHCPHCGRVQRDEFCFWCIYDEERRR